MTATAIRFHDGERWLCALARDGRKRLHLTYRDDTGIRHAAVPLEDGRHARPLTIRGAPYPVERMVRQFRRIGREHGITEAAKRELAVAQAAPRSEERR